MKAVKTISLYTILLAPMVEGEILLGQDVAEIQPMSPSSNAPFQLVLRALESNKFPRQHALLVSQDGELLLEEYWRGIDLVYGKQQRRDFGPAELHGTRSCTKSVVGLLIGIAIHEGLLPPIDTPAYMLFGDLDLEQRESFTSAHRHITLEHLLTMTDGLNWQQRATKVHVNNEAELENSPDVASYVWSQPMRRSPGAAFNYNSGATALLARALQRVAGKDIEQYAAEILFGPLSIQKWEWLRDDDGSPAAHFGLRLLPRDMVKIGQLVLQEGNWNGRQVVPSTWIKALSDDRNGSRRYGYQWWLEQFAVGNDSCKAIVAYGRGGQTIFVLPEQNAVVVLTAGHYEDNHSAEARKVILEELILPELESRCRS